MKIIIKIFVLLILILIITTSANIVEDVNVDINEANKTDAQKETESRIKPRFEAVFAIAGLIAVAYLAGTNNKE
ncbi:MAG: PGF-CTERM sorting domain-containing protein [Patescibacteria group bacterium]|nr:PGF-CTERM sorting domain-containing protein [Patescibacteria group bacterium]